MVLVYSPEVEMSGNVFFSPSPSRFQLFHLIPIPAAQRSFIPILFPVLSVIPIPSRCHSHTSIPSHLLLSFMDTVKQIGLITSKLTTNEVFRYQK